MKSVKLEDVTGEKAVRRPPPARTYVETAPEPDEPVHETADQAADRVVYGIIACFTVSALFLVNGVLAVSAGGKIPITFIAGEAEDVPMLFIMSAVMAMYGVLALRHSRTALLSVTILYTIQSLWAAWLIYAYGPSVWTSDFSYVLHLGRSLFARGALIATLWSGHEGMKAYYAHQDAGAAQEA